MDVVRQGVRLTLVGVLLVSAFTACGTEVIYDQQAIRVVTATNWA